MSQAPRRVVAGLDANGKSCVVHDSPVAFTGGQAMEVASLWTGSAAPVNNTAPLEEGLQPFSMERLFGPFYSFMYVEYGPGLGAEDPHVHFTDTADHFYVIEGEVVLVLESGDVPMKAGDVGICRGVMHGWRNDSDRPVRMITMVMPATPTGAGSVPLGAGG